MPEYAQNLRLKAMVSRAAVNFCTLLPIHADRPICIYLMRFQPHISKSNDICVSILSPVPDLID